MQDAQTSTWLPGAQAFVNAAVKQNLPLAIVTRNCQAATKRKVQVNNIPISTILTREDAPPKPDPSALLQISKAWAIATKDIAYIGDYIYDIEAAHNASMQAWLYQNNNHQNFAYNLSLILPNT